MAMKSSEDKQFYHLMLAFNEEKKISSPNSLNGWQNQYFVTKDVQISDEINILSL